MENYIESRKKWHKINLRKSNLIGHMLRRKCLLNHVNDVKIEGRLEVAGRRGRRRKEQLNLEKRR